MIKSIRLGNFKAFSEPQQIPLKPLTLIFGPNSSGKSSLIHGLLLAHEAIRTGKLDVYRTEIGGESVDLGGFRQYVHRRNAESMVEWTVELDTAKMTGRLAELFLPVKTAGISMAIGLEHEEKKKKEKINIENLLKILEQLSSEQEKEKLKEKYSQIDPGKVVEIDVPTGEMIPVGEPRIQTYEITADGKLLLKMSRRKDGHFQLDSLSHQNRVFQESIKAMVELSTTTEQLTIDDFEGLKEVIDSLVSSISFKTEKLLPDGVLHISKGMTPREETGFFPISRGQRKKNLSQAIQLFLPRILDELVAEISNVIKQQINRLLYLGPLRSYPPRHLSFEQYHDPNRFAGGGYAWDVVREDSEVRKKVNNWLGNQDKMSTPYELTIRNLLTIDDLEIDYSEKIREIEDKFVNGDYDLDLFGEIDGALYDLKANETKYSDIKELVLMDSRTNTRVSHRDVGIGISQVLPVLVLAYASQNNMIAIEQPEIHLHPRLQAELGDVFIESALSDQKNTYIIETHSEHLILRILRRIRETHEGELPQNLIPIKPEHVQIIYAQPTSKGVILHQISVNEEGEFAEKWPDGFFPERAKELF